MKKPLYTMLAALAVTCMVAAVSFAGGEYSVTGKVVSIDPSGKTVVIDTEAGHKTVNFQDETVGFKDVKPGMSVEMTCIDLEGKACAKTVEVISVAGSGAPTKTFEGEVVSIDPEGKTVVIVNPKGEKMTIKVTAATVDMVSVCGAPANVAGSKMLACELLPVRLIAPGSYVTAECFDSDGKFCANKVTVFASKAAAKSMQPGEVEGEVVSLDPAGKTVVIKTAAGEKTLYYQDVTRGAAMDELAVGSKVKAYCLDVDGKSCIREIKVAK
ncbi:MAG: hypothetical protein HZA22_06900 [Nitrospirae bacterium]|nr:hypothetical protein [Nitrospirota bacterium]MBI5695026.1 hypothetical protein [Nitrospirota bacterium]